MSSEVKKLTGTAFDKFAWFWQDVFKVEEGEDPFASFKSRITKKNRVALVSTKKMEAKK